ncbi:MAG: diaminopimelate decarboxylase [Segniliparus sp.]|uniref:diaminopimelate decarboxylase n=1 Tax=Segniliparus sp. TaxID=2804064 RepID=UPI003F3B50A1
MTPVDQAAATLAALAPEVWPKHAARGGDGVVRIAGLRADELIERYGSPLFVVDKDDFSSRCRQWADAFGARNVHYASKAFLSGQLAHWLNEEGLSLDVCSGGELAIALRGGFPPARITLHGNNKSVPELRRAVDVGVEAVVLDSFEEIERLDAVCAELGRDQDVLIRLTVGVEAHTHEAIATAHEDQKFGFSVASGVALEAARRVLARPRLRLAGFHSHIGSQILDLDGFRLAAQRVAAFVDETVRALGPIPTLHVLDLGGGLGVAYQPGERPPSQADLAEAVRKEVDQYAAAAPLAIAVEPGRSVVASGTVTLYTVGTVKDVTLPEGKTRKYVSVDGGMSDNIRPALYGAEYDVRLVSRAGSSVPAQSRVVGKHCETGDILVRDCLLPEDIAAGDILAVASTGAYCYSLSSRYNALLRPAVAVVEDGRSWLMLRRETEADLLSLEVPDGE